MIFQLKIEGSTYDLWLGVNAPLLLFEALGLVSLDRFLEPSPDGKPKEPTEEEKQSLNVASLYHSIKTYASRYAIMSVLLGDAEATPPFPYTTARELAQRTEIIDVTNFVTAVFNDYSKRTKSEGEPDAIAPQPDSAQEAAIAHSIISTDGEIFTQSNIAEGE